MMCEFHSTHGKVRGQLLKLAFSFHSVGGGDFAQAVRQACAKGCTEAWQVPYPALGGLQNGFVSGKTQG